MEKVIALLNPRQDAAPDEIWQYWAEVHGPPHVAPGLLRYCINRLDRLVFGTMPKYWGMAELWLGDKEANYKPRMMPKMQQYHEETKGGPSWFDRLVDQGAYIAEEKVIFQADVPWDNKKITKVVAQLNPAQDVGPDDLWNFWGKVHGPPHIAPGLLRYSINRYVRLVQGTMPKYWGMAELWIEGDETEYNKRMGANFSKYLEETKNLPGGDWFHRITDHTTSIMEERVIYQVEEWK